MGGGFDETGGVFLAVATLLFAVGFVGFLMVVGRWLESVGVFVDFPGAGLEGIFAPGFWVRGSGSSAFRFVPAGIPFFRSTVAGRPVGVGLLVSGLKFDDEIAGDGAGDDVGIGFGLPVSMDERTESRNWTWSVATSKG